MIFLSICIPTYNRSSYLRNTIESIISQPEFTASDEVEIVISDNCSTDDTQEVVLEYTKRFPSKIKYHKNAENILDKNYEQVLSLGSGAILKLNNDTLLLAPGSLKKILEHTKYCTEKGLIPFFLNGTLPQYSSPVLCRDVYTFISTVSYWCTWIACFSISRSVFQTTENFSRKAPLMLVQTDMLMRILENGYQILVIPDKFSESITPARKGGYNLPKVFLTNYFEILTPYFKNNRERKFFDKEKKKMLFKFVLPWIKNLKKEKIELTEKFSFDNSDYLDIVKSEFSKFTYFEFRILILMWVQFYRFRSLIKLNRNE